MQKSSIIIVVVVVAATAIALAKIFVFGHQATEIAIVKVIRGDITAKITAVGIILPFKTVKVKSSISGTVAKLFRDEGDYVKQGEVLLKLNPQPTPSEHVTKKQTVTMDLAKEHQAALNVKRYEYLLQQGMIAKNDQNYDLAKRDYQLAHNQRILDEQLLSLIQNGKATINGQQIDNVLTSPSAGFIVERKINVGDSVASQSDYQAGDALLVIADMNDLVFVGEVNETDVAKLHSGMPASLTIAAFPDQPVQGVITKLALQSAQAATKDKGTTAKLSSPFNVGFKLLIGKLNFPSTIKLRSGYSATADIIVANVTQVLIIPQRVLQFEQNKNYVWLLGDNGQPKKQIIKLGLSDEVNVEIVAGLKLDDKILAVPPEENK